MAKASLDAARIRELYWGDGLLCREVGERLGISEDAVRRRMKAFGIPTRKDVPQRHLPRAGRKNPCWRGGRRVDSGGYVRIWVGDDKYEFEHKQIAEKALGRKLKKNERVHHINGKKDDNRNANLLICTNGYHLNLHLKMKRLGIDPATLEAT
jgi:hypothetical protein